MDDMEAVVYQEFTEMSDRIEAAMYRIEAAMDDMEQQLRFEQEYWHKEQTEQMEAELQPIIDELGAWRSTGWLQEAIRKANGQERADTPAVHSGSDRTYSTYDPGVNHIPHLL